MERPQVTLVNLDEASKNVHANLTLRLMQKGFGSFASSHEILGILVEEMKELTDAVHANDLDALHNELIDIAIAAQFSIACILHGDITR